jgi:peptidoglycan/LPS O-acetylase OafA/YrhL
VLADRPPSTGPQLPKHIRALDGVRGIAVLMVLACHLVGGQDIVETSHATRTIRQLLYMGWSGVDLFFVLSGFLITGILLDTRSAGNRASSFYSRRTLRIFPLYYATVFAAILLAPHFRSIANRVPTAHGWLSYLVYLQNWYIPLTDPTRDLLGHYWSLGVEEQFYLIWPACVWSLSRKTLVSTCLAGSAFALALRCAMVWFHAPHDLVITATFARMDCLLMGAFCALAVRDSQLLAVSRRFIPYAVALALIAMVCFQRIPGELWTRSAFTQTIGLSCLALGYAALVLFAVLQNATGRVFDRLFSFFPLRLFGKYAYGIYVYHAIVLLIANRKFTTRGWLFSASLVAASLLLAVLSFHLFEQPFMRLKSRFRASGEAPAPAPQQPAITRAPLALEIERGP